MVGQDLKRGLTVIRGMKLALSEEDQRRVAEAIVVELETHNWRISLGEPGRPRG